MFFVTVTLFLFSLFVRFLLKLKLKAQSQFNKNIEHVFSAHVDGKVEEIKETSFFERLTQLLNLAHEQTYKSELKRPSALERIFQCEEGAGLLVKDTLEQTRAYSHKSTPRFDQVVKDCYDKNFIYKSSFGFIPTKSLLGIISVLPSIFIILGLLNGFATAVQGLEDIRGLDIQDVELSQAALDVFLTRMRFLLGVGSTSIAFSLFFLVLNSMSSLTDLYLKQQSSYLMAIELLWNETLKEARSHVPSRRKSDIPPPPPKDAMAS